MTSPFQRRPWSSRAEVGYVADSVSFRHMHNIEPLYRAVRRLSRAICIFPFACIAMGLLILLWMRLGSPPKITARVMSFGLYLFVFLLPALLMLYGVEHYAKQRLVQRLIESRCQLCPSCGYNLQGRARDDLACPECAYQISRRECVRRWCKLLRSRF